MHIAVAVQPDQVQRAGAPVTQLVHAMSVSPTSRRVSIAWFTELGALGKDPAGTDGVVADFAVAHVVVRWASPTAVPWAAMIAREWTSYEPVDRRRVCLGHRIRWAFGSMTHAVGDHDYDRTRRLRQRFVRCKRKSHTAQDNAVGFGRRRGRAAGQLM